MLGILIKYGVPACGVAVLALMIFPLTFLIVFGALVALGAIVTYIVVIYRSDADVQLLLKTKYGLPISSMKGKVVWITGASSGIGEQIAYTLLEAGCKLVLSSRKREELLRVKLAMITDGKATEADIMMLPLDVTAYQTHQKAVQQVLNYFKQIDVLIHCAGQAQQALWMMVEIPVDKALYDVNVLGPVCLTQHILPHMTERQEGHIVVMSCLAGKMGMPLSRSYTGAKHALQGYFESLRTELGELNIDITLLCPGLVDTKASANAATGQAGKTVGVQMPKNEMIMEVDRCAYLSCVAIANKLYEAWMAQQPILAAAYLTQYFPDISRWAARKYVMNMFAAMAETD